MKASELRIGNVVCFYGNKKPLVIKEISTESKNGWLRGYVVDNGNKTAIDCLRPEPLTEEWLLKMGFEIASRGHLVIAFNEDNVKFEIHSENDGETYKLSHYSNGFKHIKYVHQLQNLYFSLTGEELQITKEK